MKISLSIALGLLLLSPISSNGQIITEKLQNKISQKSNDFIPIRIEFKDKVDCFALNLEFKQDEVPVENRPQIVIQALIDQSDLSQNPVRDFLIQHFPDDYQNLKSFWITNMMVLEASEDLISALELREEIELIDYEDNKFIPHDKIIQADGSSEKIEGGIEPGLEAINAPAMWALGYTGRGLLVYDYDTGVWPMHPAFTDRYMGNFFPTEQSWYGYHFELPSGHINNHGTHTLGTIAGLVEETNDTIGVAFKAYWIANDYVEETVAELLPITEMVTAFEWALNPDGDLSTTHDIPDVISNSWRWYDEEDELHCEEGFVVDIMNAIEAAGIANVFSGGNFGPNNTSISSPQRINTSEVNTFSIGSVNATNFDFPYPISNFSSRGPTQCPGEGSLEIHPEVVAPGHNVRSAWRHNDFNTISGTSMATPHVAGAILLLKEAFPYLSGEDFLWALYNSAVDLGDVGEDNTFGMGMIDVFAAYELLSETNIPVDPNAVQWDLQLTEVLDVPEGGYSCFSTIHPTINVTNLGSEPIEEIEVNYQINGGPFQTVSWTGTLNAGSGDFIELTNLEADDYGDVEINIITKIVGQDDEYDIYNNRRIIRFNYRPSFDLPFQEGFESGFAFNDWHLENLDQYWTWDTIVTGGIEPGAYSASMQYFEYSPREDQVDGMVTPELLIPSDGNTTLKFSRSYPKVQSNPDRRDTLRVLVSTDCGETWPNVVFEKYSVELSTMDTLVGDFIPEFETHWKRDSVDLTQFSGEFVLIKFQGTNKKGNNLYIDNINIYNGDTEPVDVSEQPSSEFYLSPVPAHNFINVNFPVFIEGQYNLQIYNNLGQLVKEIALKSKEMVLDIHDLDAGNYQIVLFIGNKRLVKKFSKF